MKAKKLLSLFIDSFDKKSSTSKTIYNKLSPAEKSRANIHIQSKATKIDGPEARNGIFVKDSKEIAKNESLKQIDKKGGELPIKYGEVLRRTIMPKGTVNVKRTAEMPGLKTEKPSPASKAQDETRDVNKVKHDDTKSNFYVPKKPDTPSPKRTKPSESKQAQIEERYEARPAVKKMKKEALGNVLAKSRAKDAEIAKKKRLKKEKIGEE